MDTKTNTAVPDIYLASRSPRRAEILQQLGVQFSVLPSDIDESLHDNERPEDYVLRLAAEKAAACAAMLSASDMDDLPILAADTTVSIDGLILGKPADDDDARAMLRLMSGRWHEVHTGLALAMRHDIRTALSSTRVQMALLTEEKIAAEVLSTTKRQTCNAE